MWFKEEKKSPKKRNNLYTDKDRREALNELENKSIKQVSKEKRTPESTLRNWKQYETWGQKAKRKLRLHLLPSSPIEAISLAGSLKTLLISPYSLVALLLGVWGIGSHFSNPKPVSQLVTNTSPSTSYMDPCQAINDFQGQFDIYKDDRTYNRPLKYRYEDVSSQSIDSTDLKDAQNGVLLRVEFKNPPEPWNIGLSLSVENEVDKYWVVFNSDKKWNLLQVSQDGKSHTSLDSGQIRNFITSSGKQNHYYLAIMGNIACFAGGSTQNTNRIENLNLEINDEISHIGMNLNPMQELIQTNEEILISIFEVYKIP